MAHSSKPAKPAKPYPDFPLFAHATGRWAKKIRQKFHYFGKWDDPQGALDRYLDQKDDLHAGRTPRSTGERLTVRELCNRFLTSKRHLLDTCEITERTFRDYHHTCKLIVAEFGKNRVVDDLAADDFEGMRVSLAKTRGPVSIGNEITRIRCVLKYALDQGLIEKPVRYGQGFKKPSAKTLRIARARNGKRMFEADELASILGTAPQPMKTFILLGINCGYGQSDVAGLRRETVFQAIESGWIDYPRPKTGIERRCPLWPETRETLVCALGIQRVPKDEGLAELAFLTQRGQPWVRPDFDAIGQEFSKLLKRIKRKRQGINFYALRHTFETIAGGSKDQIAVNAVIGHVDTTMAGLYRERIDDERLQAVTDTVHDWLFAKKE